MFECIIPHSSTEEVHQISFCPLFFLKIFSHLLGVIKWEGTYKWWWYQSWHILRLYFTICWVGLRNCQTPWNGVPLEKKIPNFLSANQNVPHISWNLKFHFCLPDATVPSLHGLKEVSKLSFCVAGLWADGINLEPPKQKICVLTTQSLHLIFTFKVFWQLFLLLLI